MKKLLLSAVFAMVALTTTFAADLNPFAYGLESTYDPLSLTLSGEFMLNAPATSVAVYAIDADGRKYLLRSYGAVKAKGKIAFEYDLMALRIPQGVDLNWCVEVTGEAVTSVTFVNNANRLYAPTSVDIDNNPENANFGTVFVTEGRPNGQGNATYLSSVDGAGLYVFNADGTPRQIPNVGTKRYGYNGAVVGNTIQYFHPTDKSQYKAYSPYRVRVSDDGRIFITSLSPDGHVLWEANKEVFSHPEAADWSSKTSWKKVISVDNPNTTMQTTRLVDGDCSNHEWCNIGNLYSNGNFVAGPNVGFDVRGSGDNLKLLMLSGCRQAIASITPPHYHCYEYNLGEETVWDKPASKHIFTGSMESNLIKILNYGGSQVQYDKNGNIWFCQHRASADATTLARVSTNGTLWQETRTSYRRCGGIRFSNDFSQVVIASNANPKAGNSQGGGFTVYPVDATTGMPIWTQGTQVNTNSKTGVSLMDFAWDYAGNLYIAADAATNGERIAVYAMPHAADRVVSTPAALKYSFKIDCDPNVTYLVKATCSASEGSIVCTPAAYAGVVGNGVAVPSCTELTLTVTPDAAHKFTGWKDQETGKILSTDKVFTISVTRNLTLTATFEYAEYHNITWWNLFKDGEDIEKESATYPGTNERLWRLYQVEFDEYRTTKRADKGDCSGEFTVADFFSNSVAENEQFLMSETNNTTTPFVWLRKYIEYLNGGPIVKKNNETRHRWQYILPMFFNRSNNSYNSSCQDATSVAQWTGQSFVTYGKVEYWRPWWTEIGCNLPSTMTYDNHMPTMNTWKRDECSTGTIAGITPSGWYQWYVPENVPELKGLSHPILAWRHNSPTGEIVHHVWQDNMKLYASYVRKHIEESDPPAKPENYDAKNEDIIKLMANPNWDPADRVATHNLAVTRKLVKGVYNTICLPFDVELNGLMDGHPLKGATLLSFSSIDDNLYNQSGEPVTVLNFTEVPEVTIGGKPCRILQAGIPYLIKVHKDVDEAKLLEEMRFTGIGRDVLILNAYSSDTYRGVTFHGTINPTNIPEGSLILVADNRLALTTETGQMLGLRGYFTIDPMMASDIAEQAADGRVYLSMNKPVTTSIPVAPEAEQQVKPEVRKVMYDGKIYILRGEEVYTITGHRVR